MHHDLFVRIIYMCIIEVSNFEVAQDQKVQRISNILPKDIQKAFKLMDSYIKKNVDNK